MISDLAMGPMHDALRKLQQGVWTVDQAVDRFRGLIKNWGLQPAILNRIIDDRIRHLQDERRKLDNQVAALISARDLSTKTQETAS